MRSANAVVLRDEFSKPSSLADTYNVVSNSIVLSVALAVARLFDVSDTKRFPVEQQDKASVPVIAHLLKREDVQDELVKKARQWMPNIIDGANLGEADCRSAIASALQLYDQFTRSELAQKALDRVRHFRTSRLAHHLFEKQDKSLPLHSDLDLLIDVARAFVRSTVLAVEGLDRDLAREEEIKRELDSKFWELALSASLREQ